MRRAMTLHAAAMVDRERLREEFRIRTAAAMTFRALFDIDSYLLLAQENRRQIPSLDY